MIESKMPKDIRAYKTKLNSCPFTARQLLCIGVMIIVDFMLYNLVVIPLHLSSDLVIYGLIFIDLPIAAFGWAEVSGMPLEIYLRDVVLKQFLAPMKRKSIHIIYQSKSTVPVKNKKKKRITKMSRRLMLNKKGLSFFTKVSFCIQKFSIIKRKHSHNKKMIAG